MKWPSFTVIVSGIFVAYLANAMWSMGMLFYPKTCSEGNNCIKPYLAKNPPMELWVYSSKKMQRPQQQDMELLWNYNNFTVLDDEERTVNVSIPRSTRKNGTLYVHVFLTPLGVDPFAPNTWRAYDSGAMTVYTIPQAETFSLMGEQETDDKNKKPTSQKRDQPVSHWRTRLTVSVMSDEIGFPRKSVPLEIMYLLRLQGNEYLPILYVDQLSNRIRDLTPINDSCKELPLTIHYRPISIGKLRLWLSMQLAMQNLISLGFTDKDTDEMKGIFADTNFYFLMLTFTVAAFHLLFDILAFKNDISYWKNRKTMVGLSSRTVVWRCVSTFVIFLYLWDQETSLLVLIPAGVGAIIEVWKVTKTFKVKLQWVGWKPTIVLGDPSDQEKQTQKFDSQAMKYLSYVLYPLCLGGAVYSLLYTPHKSWYSWTINSLVNGVYAFGFLFMLPQLFVNYKLKSVAHLPWRAFMYKAFNTFIDDVFAFIITMPTAHRLACFRDDVVFLLYLYQRWLYPVDKTRVNEYGQSFETEDKKADGETKKTK